MKRTLFAAVAIALALVATNVQARDTSAPKYTAPSWRYQWFESRWWYWMPESKWVYWTGSNWAPYGQSSTAQTHTSLYGNYEAQSEPTTTQPAYSGGGYVQPSYSTGSGGNGYAGYGWSWGPGTAYRDAPARRF